MSERESLDTTDPVVEPSTQAPIDSTAELSAPPQETPPVDTAAEPKAEPHPLEPNGDRFKQVWARAKSAEAQLDELRRQLQTEREERIRYEERAKVQQETKQPEYSWEQLEGMIAEGRVTRAQANEYRETLVAEKARRQAEQALEAKLSQATKQGTVAQDLARYRALVPEVVEHGSETRQKLEKEYQYLTTVLGHAPGLTTELIAARTVLGPLDQVERAQQAKLKAQSRQEPFMETSSHQKPQSKAKDPIDTLKAEEKAWYEDKIKRGMYSGWDEVRSELTWERGKKS